MFALRAFMANGVSQLLLLITIVSAASVSLLIYYRHSVHEPRFLLFVPLIMIAAVSWVLLLLTLLWTYQFYQRSQEHIKVHGDVDSLFVKRMSEAPCKRAGLALAIKDMQKARRSA